jgi:hypothetical protein
MLWEYWQYLTTPCEKYVKAMGYLEEMISIKSRADRLKAEWEPHLAKTREAILRRVQTCPQRRTALICGSGWLLDVPLKELSASFEKVVLMDIVHPRAIRRLGSDRVNLIEADVSGVALSIYRDAKQLPQPSCELLGQLKDVDFVCSVNLLSQLSVIPLEYLRKHASFSEEELIRFKNSIQEFHLKEIQNSQNWILITDVESVRLDRDGNLIEKTELAKIPGHLPIKASWEWHLAPLGEDHPAESTVRRVVVCGR